jgi:hypothetical protein
MKLTFTSERTSILISIGSFVAHNPCLVNGLQEFGVAMFHVLLE